MDRFRFLGQLHKNGKNSRHSCKKLMKCLAFYRNKLLMERIIYIQVWYKYYWGNSKIKEIIQLIINLMSGNVILLNYQIILYFKKYINPRVCFIYTKSTIFVIQIKSAVSLRHNWKVTCITGHLTISLSSSEGEKISYSARKV